MVTMIMIISIVVVSIISSSPSRRFKGCEWRKAIERTAAAELELDERCRRVLEGLRTRARV